MAANDVKGPKMRVEIPDESVIPIEPAAPLLPALDRLKNYNKDDIDLSKIEGMNVREFIPKEVTDDDKLYEEISAHFRTNNETTNDIFSSSIEDSAVPPCSTDEPRIVLKQQLEDCYALCKEIGPEGLTMLSSKLSEFEAWASNTKGEERNSADSAAGATKHAVVHMTGAKYQGNSKRVYNTYTMPGGGKKGVSKKKQKK
jgi:hypothetical protein